MKDYIQNNISIPTNNEFSAIIGIKPSAGARSPFLWNAVFKTYKYKTQMYPVDVLPNDIESLMTVLSNNPFFLGGAVTVPHKEVIASWLGNKRLTKEASRIGAVNCLYRNSDGELCGTNTDGEAALKCFVESYRYVNGQNVLQLGCGGVGKATAAYFAAAGANVTLAIRDVSKVAEFANSISAEVVPWDDIDIHIMEKNIIINTTDIGFAGTGKQNMTPLSSPQIEALQEGAIVYDVIYDPCPSTMLASVQDRGLQILDGGCMNLEQAVLGFSRCFPGLGFHEGIREIMIAEKKKQGW